MNSTNYFPLDINASKKYGMERWQKEFFWPISYRSFMEVEAEIKAALNKLINENRDNDKGDLLVINYKIFFEYSNLLNALRVLKELSQKGLKPLYSADSVLFKGIMEKGIPVRRVLPNPFISRKTVLGNVKKQARLIKGAFALNGSITSLWKSLFTDTPYVANYPSLNSLAREYIASKLDGHVRLKGAGDWYPRSTGLRLTGSQEEEVRSLTEEIVGMVEKIAHGWTVELTASQREYLHAVTLELFKTTMICLTALKKYVYSLKPLHLLIGCSGNHFSRMLSTAIRNNGGTVTGFMHGEPLIYRWDKYSWLELSTVDRFVTYTKRSASMLESLLDEYPPLRNNIVKIEGAQTVTYHDLWQKMRGKPLPKKIERVMLVPKPFIPDNRLGQGISFPELMQLDWELRIVDILKRAGLKVIYKKHPDGKLRGQVVDFFDSDVEVVYDRLEDIMDCADAFVFYHTRTTAIGPALCTNKPIIYIDGGWEELLPEMRELFAKRCHIVSTKFDDNNRLIVNEKELIDALGKAPEEPDLELINEYMFPVAK